MTFKDYALDPRLQRNFQAIGFEHPTPIQSAAIPQALEGHDILGSAETGTGKTAAFMLPLLQKLISSPRTRRPRALVVVPTRELALQVADHTRQLSRNLPIRTATIYGGVGLAPQVKDYIIAAHLSTEPGHRIMLEHLGLEPLLDLNMCLGEGTGAALGIFLAETAARILSEMATFAEAGVSEGDK